MHLVMASLGGSSMSNSAFGASWGSVLRRDCADKMLHLLACCGTEFPVTHSPYMLSAYC